MARNDELERYRAALRRRLISEFVERWGVCERGHVLTDLNRDRQGRCWCCTRGHERAFEAPLTYASGISLREITESASADSFRA